MYKIGHNQTWIRTINFPYAYAIEITRNNEMWILLIALSWSKLCYQEVKVRINPTLEECENSSWKIQTII